MPSAKTALKLVLGLIVYGFTSAVVLVAIGFWWASQQFQNPGPLAEDASIIIERGSGLNRIAAQLEEAGAISNRYIFIGGVRVMGLQSDLKAGEYTLPANISAKAIAEQLRDHDVVERRVTIREGLTSYEIVRLLNGVEGLSGEITDIPPEGSLLPETYDFQLNEPRAKIIARMSKAMDDAIADLWPQRAEGLPFNTIEEAMALASIIEKETSVAYERKKVAGVFVNRLRRGMKLQTDPTVIYAITMGRHENEGKGPLGRRLLRKDWEYDSPYNTYKHAGLPPGPIANPGRASIEAALNPAAHDYIYFVADGTGGHAFGKTLAEHNRNVAAWRKVRDSQ